MRIFAGPATAYPLVQIFVLQHPSRDLLPFRNVCPIPVCPYRPSAVWSPETETIPRKIRHQNDIRHIENTPVAIVGHLCHAAKPLETLRNPNLPLFYPSITHCSLPDIHGSQIGIRVPLNKLRSSSVNQRGLASSGTEPRNLKWPRRRSGATSPSFC
ncbi:hypothetical protein LZ32DRAFT_609136 [Colletotrichum eremochloae]|nr:hypothetical protein LZ32DRAFT_609136 [Colletotrichum eremochloae]